MCTPDREIYKIYKGKDSAASKWKGKSCDALPIKNSACQRSCEVRRLIVTNIRKYLQNIQIPTYVQYQQSQGTQKKCTSDRNLEKQPFKPLSTIQAPSRSYQPTVDHTSPHSTVRAHSHPYEPPVKDQKPPVNYIQLERILRLTNKRRQR